MHVVCGDTPHTVKTTVLSLLIQCCIMQLAIITQTSTQVVVYEILIFFHVFHTLVLAVKEFVCTA